MKKTLTKTLCILLAAVLFLVLLPQLDLASVATAETAQRADALGMDPGLILLDSGEDLPVPTPVPTRQEFENLPCGPNLWATLKGDVLTITGTGPMEGSFPWLKSGSIDWQYIHTVKLPKGLTTIGPGAFPFPKLRSITIPYTVTSIEERAFAGSGLEKVDLPASVTWIKLDAFKNCSSLKEMIVRDPDCQVETLVEQDDSWEDLFWYRPTLGTPSYTRVFSKHVSSHGSAAASGYSYVEDYAKAAGHKFYPLASFTDVAPGKFYDGPVSWAAAEGITTGVSGTKFDPNGSCTRGQVVTFLWRANGSPEPTRTRTSFTDVNAKAYYYKAMLWAVETGVTTGTSDTTFAPDKPCTRGQVVTFLWRAKGKPLPLDQETGFTDVNKSGYYYDAMRWAVQKGVTNGTSDTAFTPNGICTRGQVVTFLFRADFVPASFNYLDSQFLLYAEEVYTITDRGPVVTGRVVNGRVKVGDKIKIMTTDSYGSSKYTYYTQVESIEMFHRTMDEAVKGDNVGILLGSNVTASQIKPGAALVHQGSNLDFCNYLTIIGTLNLNGSAGSGIELNGEYQFYDAARDYTCKIQNLNGSSPMPMGTTRTNVKINTRFAVVWFPGQVLKVRQGGWTYGEFTILQIMGSK